MAARLMAIDRDTPLLLPPNLRDWVPDDHLVHFLLDAVDALDLRRVKVNTRGPRQRAIPAAQVAGAAYLVSARKHLTDSAPRC